MKNSTLTNWYFIFLGISNVIEFIEALEYGSRVDEFVNQFTSLFNQYPLAYREKDLDAQYLNALKQHFPNLPDSYDPLYDGPQTAEQGYPPSAPFRPRPPLNPPTNDIGSGPLLGSIPIRPHRPLYRPPLGAYPQTSLITALDSIAKYDDLHCVPRLMCEVTSGSNTTGNKKKGTEEASPIPFLSREGVIALLTVLNFVDDSPILLFLRAAFLGYSSKGDPKVCLNGYPLCPKDPDQLVNYLNNHNGGFFRFFNRQLRRQPHYPPHVHKRLNATDEEVRGGGGDLHFSPRLRKLGFAARILNDPIEIEDIGQYYGKIANIRQQIRDPPQYQSPAADPVVDGNEQNSALPARKAKKIAFPGRPAKSAFVTANVMIFPDRTGTGNLVLSGDPSVGLKISFADDDTAPETGKTSKVKFLYDRQRYPKKMRFPEDED